MNDGKGTADESRERGVKNPVILRGRISRGAG